jgi:hypothetical protein
MKNKISFLGVIAGITGSFLVATNILIYGFIIFILSNILLGYTNKHDKNQVVLFIIYTIINIYGILRLI